MWPLLGGLGLTTSTRQRDSGWKREVFRPRFEDGQAGNDYGVLPLAKLGTKRIVGGGGEVSISGTVNDMRLRGRNSPSPERIGPPA